MTPDDSSQAPSTPLEPDHETDAEKFDRQARLEIYKLIVEMADRMTARRSGTNSFFLTVNAALVTFVGLFGSTKEGDTVRFEKWGLAVAGVA